MGIMIFLAACLAGEGFLLYCLFHFVRESRRMRQQAQTGTMDGSIELKSQYVLRLATKHPGAHSNLRSDAATLQTLAPIKTINFY
jgi:hypothetical protein